MNANEPRRHGDYHGDKQELLVSRPVTRHRLSEGRSAPPHVCSRLGSFLTLGLLTPPRGSGPGRVVSLCTASRNVSTHNNISTHKKGKEDRR
jgi:hypothetical protein